MWVKFIIPFEIEGTSRFRLKLSVFSFIKWKSFHPPRGVVEMAVRQNVRDRFVNCQALSADSSGVSYIEGQGDTDDLQAPGSGVGEGEIKDYVSFVPICVWNPKWRHVMALR